MGRTPSRTDKKTSESRGENGKILQSLTDSINEKVNAAEEKVQEIEERGKPKKENSSSDKSEDGLEFSEKEKAETLKFILERFPKRQGRGSIPTMHLSYGSSKGHQKELAEKRKLREAWNNTVAEESKNSVKPEKQQEEVKDENESTKEATTTVDPEDILKQLEAAKKKIEELSKTNQSLRSENSILNDSIKQRAEEDAKKSQETKEEPKTEEVKTDNSAKTEETVAPETGEAKVEGEPKANTEQAQTTQEPKSEAKQTSTESSEMTPEEAYEYLSDKKNFKEANTYFSSGKDSYIGTNGKHLPKSWFDVYKGNKDSDHSIQHKFFNSNNKDLFTASLRDKGLLEDSKKEPSREDTVSTLAEADAKAKFDDWVNSKGNKFRGIIGKHPWISGSLLLSVGAPLIMKAINAFMDYGREQAVEDMQVPDKEFWGESDYNEDFNGDEPDKVTEDLSNAAQETGQADNTAEEQAAQALQENLPQGEADATNQSKGESPAATNASTPASTKASTAKPAPTQDTTQGLPPVVTRNTPSANPDSSGMTYSQRVEAGQTPQEGSMVYNANNHDMVTANLINAMNQAPQAGSDAIGYGDLYDQNFIDFWAKRNPNLAYAVSQGRKS